MRTAKTFFLILVACSFVSITAHAQSPARIKAKYLQMKLVADPDSIDGSGVIFYDTDSTVKVVNPDGSVSVLGGQSGTPAAGSNTQVQFNNSGALAGDAGFVYNSTTNRVTCDSILSRYKIAAGSATTQVLFNNAAVITGDAGMVYNSTSNRLTVDSIHSIYWLNAGSATTEVLFNSGSIVTGDAGMVYNLTNNLLTTDSVRALGGMVLASGTAANPAIYFRASGGVGFFRSASNVLGIATAGTERVQVDAQGDVNITGGRGFNSTTDTDIWADFAPTDAQQDLSGPGAVNITSYYTAITTTGTDAFTFANGTNIGQIKKITMVVDNGDATITPTSLTGGTTITMDNVGEYVILKWTGTAWTVIENNGATIA